MAHTQETLDQSLLFTSEDEYQPINILTHTKVDKVTIFILNIILFISLGMTGFCVYAEGRYYTQNQYNFPLWYPVLCILAYGSICLFHPTSYILLKSQWNNPHYIIIGFLWSANYCYILTANTYIPNSFQIILVQMSLITTFFMNINLLNSSYSSNQKLLILASIILNIFFTSEINLTLGLGETIYWYWVFFLNQTAAAVASILSEAFFKHQESIMPKDMSQAEKEFSKVMVLNCVTNFYSFIGMFLLMYINIPIDGTISKSMFFSSNLYDGNSWSYYCMFLSTLFYTTSSSMLFRYTSVTYTYIMGNIANFIEIIIIASPIGFLQSPTNTQTIVIYLCLILVTSYFAVITNEKHNNSGSWLVTYYDNPTRNKTLCLLAITFMIYYSPLPFSFSFTMVQQ
jgi:hypothetical protein